MSLKLSEFRSSISDLARPNRFDVGITPPLNLFKTDSTELAMQYWAVQSATIPQRTQGEITIKYHGMELKLPGDYAKENLTVSFLNSYGWEGRNFFEKWMEWGMQDTRKTNGKAYAYDVISGSKVIVNQLGRTEKDILASYTFYDAFPTSISAIELSMANNDQIETFTVTFAYSYWENTNLK